MLATLIAQLGLNDINPGSVIDILTQAAAQSDFALYYQIAQVSRIADIEALTGDELDLKAFEYGLFRRTAQKATGTISVQRPDGFVKVSTTFYAGFPSPIVGDTTIFVNNASSVLISTSGTLVLGRGTNNEEEITYSSAPIDNTNYFTFTLDTPLAKNHSTAETIVLKQGNDEPILAGTTVVVPATGTTEEIQFATVNDEVLLSGESEITGVEDIAIVAGTDGNVPSMAINGISAFPSPPFAGAKAVNTAKYSSGRDRETDDELRDRIKDAVPALSRGVKQAILNAIVGLVDPVSAKRVVSASVVLPVEDAEAVKVYIDDGTGFEPSFGSVGFEAIKSNSSGGEQRLQLDQFPDVKAQIENNISEPYDFSTTKDLSYEVGSISETITFNTADFRFPDIATAEEVAAAINDKASLIEARTSQGATKVTITAKAETNENLQITGGTSNFVLGFPTDRKSTLNLYIDDVKKSKDGETAILDSRNTAPFNLLAIGAYPHDFQLIVDGKAVNTQTATIDTPDVDDPSAVTVAEICAVLNRDLAGVTAKPAFQNTVVRLESNTKLSSSSKLEVSSGSLNDSTNGLNFSTMEKVGTDGDYLFNRELGIVQLTEALGANQTVTAGSLFTRAKLRAGSAELYTPSNGQTLVFSVDGGGFQTVTFDNTFAAGKTAADTAAFINLQLRGATAVVRQVGSINYLEVRTNTFTTSGSIFIRNTSTANGAFAFATETTVTSDDPNKAFRVTGTAGPYNFAEGDTLVLVVDNDIVNSTFSILFNVAKTLTGTTSTTVFASTQLPALFPFADQIVGYYAAFTAGANTTSGTLITVTDEGGGTARYTFDMAPTNFSDYAVGDLIKITGLDDSENNVNGVVTAKGADYVEIKNLHVVNASGQNGTGVLSQKRTITDYNQATGGITVGVAFSNVPSVSDPILIIPHTTQNTVEFLNNTKITSLSLKADIEGVNNNLGIQISSKAEGSDGYIQITGGSANAAFLFATSLYRGLAGYQYWTGLIDLVHKVIYGDDTDLVSFPGIGASGVIFRFLAPTLKNIPVELNVTLREGVTIAALENEIRSAVTGYVNNLGVGEDVVIEEIRAAVIAIAGVIDVAITDPAANIAIADNELARVADSAILIG